MRYLIVPLLLLFINSSTVAQPLVTDSAAKANVKKQGTAMAKLLLKKDYKAFAAFTYAPIIKMVGGQDKMASFLEKGFKDMEGEGFTIANITIGDCSAIIHTDKQLQCTLTEVIEMKHTDGKLIQKFTLIGISSDKGATWTFIDTHGAALKELQETLEELSDDLVIPEFQEPTIIHN